jgi:chromosome segregation ATPase
MLIMSSGYEQVQIQTARLKTLPSEIENLQQTIDHLQAEQGPKSSNPDLCMALQPTMDLLLKREQQMSEIDAQISALRSSISSKRQDFAKFQDELSSLQARKTQATQEALEAKRRREEGKELGDELGEEGRWLRGVEHSLKIMLEV